MSNPWNIKSIYDLQYFNCPSCVFKDSSEQEIINHAYEFHPESIEYLENIKNDCLMYGIVWPWKNKKSSASAKNNKNKSAKASKVSSGSKVSSVSKAHSASKVSSASKTDVSDFYPFIVPERAAARKATAKMSYDGDNLKKPSSTATIPEAVMEVTSTSKDSKKTKKVKEEKEVIKDSTKKESKEKKSSKKHHKRPKKSESRDSTPEREEINIFAEVIPDMSGYVPQRKSALKASFQIKDADRRVSVKEENLLLFGPKEKKYKKTEKKKEKVKGNKEKKHKKSEEKKEKLKSDKKKKYKKSEEKKEKLKGEF